MLAGRPPKAGIEGLPQPLPGVVLPQLAQLGIWALAVGQVTAGWQPGQQRDQGRVVVACETGRVAQRVHAAW
jgi:hypothetical protein